MRHRPVRPRRAWAAATIVAALVVIAGWSVASPLGAGPDDDFHQTSIWCPPPVETSGCKTHTARDGVRTVEVPSAIVVGCYRQDPSLSAACSPTSELMESPRFDDGQYPGPYYHLLHPLASDHPARSVVAIRLFNGALAVALATIALACAPCAARGAIVLAILGTWVPLGVFLVTSVNPSGWALTGVSTYWALLLALLVADRRRVLVISGAGAVLAGLVATASRADAAAFIIVSTAAVLILVRPQRERWPRLWIPAATCMAAAAVVLTSGQADVVEQGIEAENLGRPLSSLLWVNLTEFPTLIAGALGTWNLGWLDTVMPSGTWFGTIAVFCSLIGVGLRTPDRWKLIALAVLTATMVGITLRVLIVGQDYVGESVQPRYILPLLPVVVGIALLRGDGTHRRLLTRAQGHAVAAVIAVSHALALHANIRRYVTGQDVRAFNLDHDREWWWWSSPGPMTVWFISSLAFGFVAWSLVGRPHWGLGEIDPESPIEVGSSAQDLPPTSKVTADPAWQ